MDYEELLGWMEYFRRRPPEWRADNRAAVATIAISSSFSGSNLKPEDLFDSLRVIKKEVTKTSNTTSIGQKFFDRFSNRMTEEITFNV